MLATFSPCIEQVHRTRGALAAENFWDVRMFECLLRDYEVRSESMVADLDAHATSSFTGAGVPSCWSKNSLICCPCTI